MALPCNFTLSPQTEKLGHGADVISQREQSDQISLILWYKSDSGGVPIYTVDARHSASLATAKHTPGAAFRNRATFVLDTLTPVLIIDPLTDTDEGEYRCRVDFRKARTQNFLVRLNLTGEYIQQSQCVRVLANSVLTLHSSASK